MADEGLHNVFNEFLIHIRHGYIIPFLRTENYYSCASVGETSGSAGVSGSAAASAVGSAAGAAVASGSAGAFLGFETFVLRLTQAGSSTLSRWSSLMTVFEGWAPWLKCVAMASCWSTSSLVCGL